MIVIQEITFKNGDVFKGEMKGKKVTGTGEMLYSDGSVYRG